MKKRGIKAGILKILNNFTESHHTINRVFQAIHNTPKTLLMLVNSNDKMFF